MTKLKEFYYKLDGKQCPIESKGNMISRIGMVSWNGNQPKLEIRKWTLRGEELVPNKGFTFMTEEGPTNLVHTLVQLGYGDINVLRNILDQRELIAASNEETMFTKDDLLKDIKGGEK